MRARWWDAAILALLVALFLAQAAFASPRKSASFDEQYHLAAGYSYLRTGDSRLATTHPPLMGALAALPLLARDDVAPQFTDHCFTGEYPTELTDQNGQAGTRQLSLLAEVG